MPQYVADGRKVNAVEQEERAVTRLFRHLASGLDPVQLAESLGLECDPWQLDVLRARDHRLCLNVHRQGDKSTIAALLALHEALYNPGALILMVSPSQRQSQELFKRAVAYYRSLGKPVPPEIENQLSLTLESGSRIVSLPGDERTIRGYSSVALLIIDEAARVEDELVTAVSPMLSISRGRFVAVSTPAGSRGWWYQTTQSSDWRTVTVTASECPRLSAEILDQERRQMGDLRFRSEYLCEFVDPAGKAFNLDDILAILEPRELDIWPDSVPLPGAAGPVPEVVDVPSRPVYADPVFCPESFGTGHRFRVEPTGTWCQACGGQKPLLIPSGEAS